MPTISIVFVFNTVIYRSYDIIIYIMLAWKYQKMISKQKRKIVETLFTVIDTRVCRCVHERVQG